MGNHANVRLEVLGRDFGLPVSHVRHSFSDHSGKFAVLVGVGTKERSRAARCEGKNEIF